MGGQRNYILRRHNYSGCERAGCPQSRQIKTNWDGMWPCEPFFIGSRFFCRCFWAFCNRCGALNKLFTARLAKKSNYRSTIWFRNTRRQGSKIIRIQDNIYGGNLHKLNSSEPLRMSIIQCFFLFFCQISFKEIANGHGSQNKKWTMTKLPKYHGI